MNMLDITKQALDSRNALTPGLNSHIQRIVNAIPYNVNDRMKAVIAVSQLTTFASQFRRNIMLWDDTSVPINAISFAVTGSGEGKDSSVKAARKCFTSGYEAILNARYSLAVQQAIRLAAECGDEPSTEYDIYKAYLKPLPPIDIMPTTGPGLIQHINDIGEHSLCSGFTYSGEFSDELAYNPDMLENIKVLSEIYDTGDKEVKYTKGIEHRSKAIKSQPVSALFVGSPGHILYDESTKKKFNIAFMSKLARRSWFCYAPEKMPKTDFSHTDDPIGNMIKYETELEESAKSARLAMKSLVDRITSHNLTHAGKDLTVPESVFALYKTYQRYNSDLADSFPHQSSTSVLIRRHLQWKAIKLAGAFAIFDCQSAISDAHYIDAIRFCELLANDMDAFEYDLSKADHERFSDFIRTQPLIDGKAIINVHDLKKRNFVATTTKAKLQELVTLCCAYDTNGVYSIVHEGSAIAYEPIIKTDKLHVSFKPIQLNALRNAVAAQDDLAIKNAKQQVAMSATYGFDSGETTFPDLANLLANDYAYSPFRFRNGTRGKENVYGSTKWLVYDIDHSPLSAAETSFMLSDINHHIAISSDPNNEYKFRLLIELDSAVELDSITWKHFYTSVANHLAIRIDVLPQSQIFYSYAGHPVISVLDASPLNVRSFVIDAKDRRANSITEKPFSSAQQKALLADPLETFKYCYEAETGEGSRSMIRMAYHMRDLGASQSDVISALEDVQSYWTVPMEETRFRNTILTQIPRIFNK